MADENKQEPVTVKGKAGVVITINPPREEKK